MSDGTETVWAVVLGAVLATVGGFTATRLEEILRRRERERGAALLFGAILAALEQITIFAEDSRGHGDPYGPVTLRLLRAARRETEVYDRNRESLYDLRDGALRARIHALMVRLTLALDGVFDATAALDLTLAAAGGLADTDPGKADALARLDELLKHRQTAFDFAMETVAETKPLMSVLQPLAGQPLDAHAEVVRNPPARSGEA